MVNIFRQRIAVFYKDIEWVRRFMDAVYKALPRGSVASYISVKHDIRIEMMDESYLIALPVGEHRGFRFDKIFFQEGINIDGFNCILACSSAIFMVNDSYEIVELPFKKHRCIEDRSNKTIKTMTGYDYIEAVIGLPSVVQIDTEE
jgi:hypothetical protein